MVAGVKEKKDDSEFLLDPSLLSKNGVLDLMLRDGYREIHSEILSLFLPCLGDS